MQKLWKELFNETSAVAGNVSYAPTTFGSDWDAFVVHVEAIGAAASFTLSGHFGDGTSTSLSSGVLGAGVVSLRLSLGRGVDCDAISGALQSWPTMIRVNWSVTAGGAGTASLRVYGVKIG